MVEINKELIEKVAKLANLNLTEQETKKFEQDFKEILNAFKVLDKVDVSKVESSFRPFEERNHVREDIVRESLKDPLAQIKNKENNFFKAPRTV